MRVTKCQLICFSQYTSKNKTDVASGDKCGEKAKAEGSVILHRVDREGLPNKEATDLEKEIG